VDCRPAIARFPPLVVQQSGSVHSSPLMGEWIQPSFFCVGNFRSKFLEFLAGSVILEAAPEHKLICAFPAVTSYADSHSFLVPGLKRSADVAQR